MQKIVHPHVALQLLVTGIVHRAVPRSRRTSSTPLLRCSQPTTRGRESLSNFPSSHKKVSKQLLSWRPRCVVCDSTPSPPISLFNLLSTSDSSRETHMCTTWSQEHQRASSPLPNAQDSLALKFASNTGRELSRSVMCRPLNLWMTAWVPRRWPAALQVKSSSPLFHRSCPPPIFWPRGLERSKTM